MLERAAEGGIINAKYELASKGFYNHYYELLEQKYWKAVKDVFFLGVFDFGAMSFLEIGYNNHSLPNQPLTKREIMQLIEKFVLENSPGISIKNCLQDIKSKICW